MVSPVSSIAPMERDLGAEFGWVAVNRYNTGRDLIIAREYMAQAPREWEAALVSLNLGSRTDLEIENRLRRAVEPLDLFVLVLLPVRLSNTRVSLRAYQPRRDTRFTNSLYQYHDRMIMPALRNCLRH